MKVTEMISPNGCSSQPTQQGHQDLLIIDAFLLEGIERVPIISVFPKHIYFFGIGKRPEKGNTEQRTPAGIRKTP